MKSKYRIGAVHQEKGGGRERERERKYEIKITLATVIKLYQRQRLPLYSLTYFN